MNILKAIRDNINSNNIGKFINPKPNDDICCVCREEKPPLQIKTLNGRKVCNSCYAELPSCKICRYKSLALNEVKICRNCTSNYANVRNYSHKPNPLFHRVNSRKNCFVTDEAWKYRHFGVEIETDTTDCEVLTTQSKIASMAHLIGRGITQSEQLLYVKEDSTCSYEFVSHPFTWRYFNNYGKHIFYTLFKMLKNDGFVSHNAEDSVFHVHVSKASVKHTTLFKALSLMYNPSNYDFILDVSQREEDSLNEWASCVLYDNFVDNVKNPYTYLTKYQNNPSRIDSQISRSTAINLLPRNTIEFRLFRGSLNMNVFLKNLQFIRSVLSWSDKVSLIEAQKSGLESYLNYLEKNQYSYYDLCFFLKKRGWRKFKKATDYLSRKHTTNLINLKYNSDNKELFKCV